MAVTLNSANQSYLDRIKNDISSRSNGEAIRKNALSQLDRRLSAKELTQDQYDFLKTQISSVGKPMTPTVNTIDNKQELLQSTKDLTLDQRKEVMKNQASTTPNVQPSVGPTDTSNPNTKAFDDTGLAMEENAKKYSQQVEDSAMKYANQEQQTIQERDADKLKRTNDQEAQLKFIKDRAETNYENRRNDADKLYQMQEDVASRNANITAAQAVQSGLALSQAELDSIRNDTIAKYGQNLTTAKDLQNKTNMSIDEALTKTGLDIFNKQSEIDKFKDALNDAEFAPIINAVQKAAEGDKKAIDDVYNYYTEFTKKKAEEEYNRMAKSERLAAEETEFQSADWKRKEQLIFERLAWIDKAADIPGYQYVIQNIASTINKYPNSSMTFILGTVMEEAMNNADARAQLLAMASNGTIKDPDVLNVINTVNKEVGQTQKWATARSAWSVETNKKEDATIKENNPTPVYNNPQATPVESNYATTYKFSDANQKFIDTWKPRLASDPNKKNNVLTMLNSQLASKAISQTQYNAIKSALGI